MLSSVNLSSDSIDLLQRRGLSDQQIGNFAELLTQAKERVGEGATAKQALSELTKAEMTLLQQATSLADPIQVNTLSNEGATNLLAQPDRSGMVDLNNDGIVEVGKAQTISFPPVNAPDHVKSAWDTATEGMAEADRLILELNMHHAVYGVQIDGVETKTALPPEQQWSAEGWQQLLSELEAALAFDVSMDGWDRYSLLKQDFYQKFDTALQSGWSDIA